jgi:hypothetical protein
MIWFRYTALIGVLGAAACGGRSGEKAATGRTPQAESAGGMMPMPGMDSGKGMTGMRMHGMEMMPMMRAHMDSMARMSPDQMRAMLGQHDAMMSQMMDRMGADVRSMNMSGDPKWNALTDSVKRDLADLPNLKGKALTDRMRAHADRVSHLMTMHEQMMKGAKPR